MKIAINGIGIAGPTLAYWLHRYGHEPVPIEKAPQLRTGGYIVDFWGIGYDIADKMGLIPQIQERGYNMEEIRWVDDKGHKSGSFDPDTFRQMTKGRFVSLERSDLAMSLYSTIENKVETIFGDSIASIEDKGDGVRVTFDHATPRDFDVVVGADGLHSRVRDITFGSIEQFEKDLGLRVAAFELEGYPREELVFISHTEPGRQVSRVSKRNDKTLFLLGFRDRFAGNVPTTNEQRKAAIEQAFDGFGWEWSQISAKMQDVDDIYYDRVSQIHMKHWYKGRTGLIGDAAAAVSLLAGEGTGLGMAEAYVLAGELSRIPDDPTVAFARYEKHLIPFVERKQKAALNVGSTFVPDSQFGIFARDLVTRLFSGPWVAKLGLGDLADDIELPTYEEYSRIS